MYMPSLPAALVMLLVSWWSGVRVRARAEAARSWPIPGDRWSTLIDEVEVAELATRGAVLSVMVRTRKGGQPAGSWWLTMPQFHARIRGFTLTQRGGGHE